MSGGPWDIVVSGVACNRATGALRQIEIRWWTSSAGVVAEVRVAGRDDPFLRHTGPQFMTEFAAYLFGHGGDGGEDARPPIADPVNIDGSPRNKLRDRLVRNRHNSEAMAAD